MDPIRALQTPAAARAATPGAPPGPAAEAAAPVAPPGESVELRNAFAAVEPVRAAEPPAPAVAAQAAAPPPPAPEILLAEDPGLHEFRSVRVASDSDPAFASGLAMIQRAFPANVVDPPRLFADQLRMQRDGEWGADSYRFLTVESPSGHTRGVATLNYLAGSNVAFENYLAADSPEAAAALTGDMEAQAREDAARNGQALLGLVVEADPSEVAAKKSAGYLTLEGLDYVQPPLGRGYRPEPLPLMLKVADSDHPALVKEGDRVVGLRSEAALGLVKDMYHTIYERDDLYDQTGAPTRQYAARVLASLEGKDFIPLA